MSGGISFWRKLTFVALGILGAGLGGRASHAAVIEEIARDFKPLAGYVVMVQDEEYIIDLDETQGVALGHIFSVVKPGKPMVHPVTQKVLGTLEEVKGILKIIRLKSGYSFARPLGKTVDIQKGDPIRRYENLPALFWDYTGKGKPFFAQLQSTLPSLKWRDYESAQRTRPPTPGPSSQHPDALLFILTSQGVEVRDPEFYELRRYGPPESTAPVGAIPSSAEETMAPKNSPYFRHI
ncbi:MAG: hypothetical protein JSW39_23450 [Desulfobacterales bacterium]|nr:MAG: hypothetical protein JSW39_23450 [Desulfobacterales bacterium]